MTTVCTTRGTYYECRRYGDVTGAEPLPHPFSTKQWTPNYIKVTYYINAAGQWVPSCPTLSGTFNRQDGSVGKQETSVTYYSDDKIPGWAVTWLETNTPTMREPSPDAQAAKDPMDYYTIDGACCQTCGWRGLETQLEYRSGEAPGSADVVLCPMLGCRSSAINYFFRPRDVESPS